MPRHRFSVGLAALGVFVLAVSALSGCTPAASEEPAAPPPVPEAEFESLAQFLDPCAKPNLTTVEPGALTFATATLPSPPFFFTDEPSDREGVDSELAYVLAEELGFRPGAVTWVIVPAEQILSGEFIDFDIAIGGLSASQANESSLVFSQAYASVNVIDPLSSDDSIAGPQVVELNLGMVEGNPLAACVDEALIEMSEVGTLKDLRERWLDPQQLG